MKIVGKITAGVIAAMLIAGSASAQNTPTPGGSDSGTETFLGMPVGSHVMIGGVLFLVVVGGLILADDDDDNTVTPTPTPAPPPASTTTTTTS